ncbi:MAG: ABC transporter transmembrane domain-containing protein, partial [Thermocrispum sp.]
MQATGRVVLREAIRGQRRYVAGAAALAAGHQGCEAMVPVVIGVVIDSAVSTGSLPRLLAWLGVLAVLFAALSLCFRFADRAAQRAGEQAAHELRRRLTRRVLDPHGGADGLPGALVTVATGDVKRVGAVAAALPYGVAALSALTVSAVVLLTSSVPLGLLILLGTPPVLWLTRVVGRPLERRSHGEQERAAEASGVAADLVA